MFSQGIIAHSCNKPSTGLRQWNATTKIMACAINQVPLYNPVIYIHSLSRYILHQVLNYSKLLLRPISLLQKHYSEFTADIFLVALHLQRLGLEKLWYTQKVGCYWLGFENERVWMSHLPSLSLVRQGNGTFAWFLVFFPPSGFLLNV